MANRKPGLGKRGNVEKNAKVFHVVQRTNMKLPLFESDKVYNYWISRLKFHCIEENVTILAAIMMTNHYHALLYAESPDNIQRVFQKLNTGLSLFVKLHIVNGSKFESYYSTTNPYKLFSSAERLFPVEGLIPLLIDTKYLFDNPKHHGCMNIGLRYQHSTFSELYSGQMEKRDFKVFADLYGGMYPRNVISLISRSSQDFWDGALEMKSRMNIQTENRLFKIDPNIPWRFEHETVQDSYQMFDI